MIPGKSGSAAAVLITSLWLSLLSACGGPPSSTGHPAIVNGRPVSEDTWPSVVFLMDKARGSVCTGTFVHPRQILTAAHCTVGGGLSGPGGHVRAEMHWVRFDPETRQLQETVAVTHQVVRAVSADDDWATGNPFPRPTVNPADIALLTFAEAIAPAVSGISPAAPRSGDELTLVGYGLGQNLDRSNGSTCCRKREGRNNLDRNSGGYLRFAGALDTDLADGSSASNAPGDSGGPAFANGMVAGVASGGRRSLFGSTYRNTYVDLNSRSSRRFLGQHLLVD